MKLAVALAPLLLTSGPASAQEDPRFIPDSRVQTMMWSPDQVVRLTAEPGSSLTVILAASERIVNVTVGDTASFQVTVSGAGDSLFVKPLARYGRTNLTVLTDTRRYLFELETVAGSASPYVVQFDYPKPPSLMAQTSPTVAATAEWKFKGSRNIRPVAMSDDGMKTFIEWASGQSLPAVFAIGATGAEEVVDGYMRDGRFVIDRVHERLVFRIDHDQVTATRKSRPSRP